MSNEFDDALTGARYEGVEMKRISTGYRIVLGLSVLSLVCGVFSSVSFLSWWLLLVPVFGLAFGAVAVWRVLKAPEELGGYYLAVAGCISSFVLGTACTVWLFWDHYGSVPAGYILVDFNELALTKERKVPPHIAQLGKERRKIYIKGYMYRGSGRRMRGITDFTLVRAKEHCKFCSPEQNPADMIDVRLVGGLKVPFRTRAIRIGGTFYVNENFAYGQLPYYMEADVFR